MSAPASSPPTRVPAVLYAPPGLPAPAVAALTTLDRLLVAAHRAGCGPIHLVGVSREQIARLRRALALAIPFESSPTPPVFTGPAFVASTDLLLTARDVKLLVAQQARLCLDGQPAAAGWARAHTGNPAADLAGAPLLKPAGPAARVFDDASARSAARSLWASLGSSSDGTVDKYFNRPLGRFLSRLLIHTAVSPNQISVAATLLGVVSAASFAVGSHPAAVAGAVLLQLSAIIDCVDGDVARMVFKESPLGKWLDIVGDQVVHLSVFVAIGIGLWRAGTDAPVLALAASAGLGVLLSFGVILRSLLRPQRQNSALQRLIDATTNRDFSVLLLFLAWVDRLTWFLWLTAIGVHVFWILALSLQLTAPRDPVPSRG